MLTNLVRWRLVEHLDHHDKTMNGSASHICVCFTVWHNSHDNIHCRRANGTQCIVLEEKALVVMLSNTYLGSSLIWISADSQPKNAYMLWGLTNRVRAFLWSILYGVSPKQKLLTDNTPLCQLILGSLNDAVSATEVT